jgi:L-asparaginase II
VTRFDHSFEPIAVATRSGLEESLHHGAGAGVDPAGEVVACVGDPHLVVYPRSCLKPLQAEAMVACGLDVPDDLLAVACASHDGAPVHVDTVREILSRAGLSESALQNTPGRPLSDPASVPAPASIYQNCSGKHAAMLATCVVNGWPTESYLDAEHPLQRAITDWIEAFGCAVRHVGVDGCGAPTHALSLSDLARAYGRLSATDATAANAMRRHPVLVGGAERDVTWWLDAVTGCIAKEGAAGVMAVGLDDGRAFAFKIADGADRARQAVVPAGFRSIGVDIDVIAPETVDRVVVPMLGHGRVVGRLDALDWSSCGS